MHPTESVYINRYCQFSGLYNAHKASDALVVGEVLESTRDTHSHLCTGKLSEGFPFPPGQGSVAIIKVCVTLALYKRKSMKRGIVFAHINKSILLNQFI